MDPLDDDEPSGIFDVPPDGAGLTAADRARVIAGRYEILERVGSGGMGQVLRVRHLRLGKTFALKLMHPELSLDPAAEQQFHREARLASHLSHPNIVEMIDFGNDPDWGWFIVMEYLDGEPLSQRIEQLGQLPIAAACQVAAQLADALVHSHVKQVVHADLKTENVLCLAPGDETEPHPWQVKLLDFGTAHVATTSPGSAEHIAGTPEYLAPERITGGQPEPSGDVYALGVILYEMLCGTPPFSGGEPQQILMRHLTEAPEPVGARRGEVLDARLDAILDKALAKDPAQRYPSAQDMLDELRGYLEVLGVRQRAGTLSSLITVDRRADAAAAAFDSLRLPAAGLLRDGTIVIANDAFARVVADADVGALEGQNIRGTVLAQLNPDLHDDLRSVALDGEVIRRYLSIPRGGKQLRVRYILAPASGACGHCMLVLHSG